MPVSYRHIIYIHFPYLAASRIQRMHLGKGNLELICRLL